MGRQEEALERSRRALSIASDRDFESLEEEAEEQDDNTSRETHRMTEEEEAEEVYGGLAAEELEEEKLFPGDTIEYFSMAFVFGDPRGHRVAKVLKVAHREREYPLRLDSQEMLPSTLMIKRLLTRRGEELEPGAAVWRKIRTFGLVDGQVKGKTRADILNEGLKKAVSGAFQSVYKSSSSKPDNQTATHKGPFAAFKKPKSSESSVGGGPKKPKTRESEPQHAAKTDKSATKNTLCITSFFTKAPKGSLEAVVTAKSSSSKASVATAASSSNKSERRHDATSSSKVLGKRPRVELTPSPSTHKHRDRDHMPSSSPGFRKHKDDRSHRHERSPGKRDDRPHKTSRPKVQVAKFVAQIEEIEQKRHNPRLRLDDYLALEDKEKAAKEEFELVKKAEHETKEKARPTNSSSGSGSGISSSRMRASGGGADEGRRKEKGRVRMRSLHTHFKSQPRPHPDAQKRASEMAPGASKLNFMMDTENDSVFTRPAKLEDKSKSRSKDSKDARSREVSKSPKKKGLAPSSQDRMGVWIDSGKR